MTTFDLIILAMLQTYVMLFINKIKKIVKTTAKYGTYIRTDAAKHIHPCDQNSVFPQDACKFNSESLECQNCSLMDGKTCMLFLFITALNKLIHIKYVYIQCSSYMDKYRQN